MGRHKDEVVTVSFHYLQRELKKKEADPQVVPLRQGEFESLFGSMAKYGPLDHSDESYVDQLRLKVIVPLEQVTKVNDRTIFGLFKASYWGHAYDNTAKGRIPADSISLRPFHFLLYLSDSGRIYIASQYLGHFGGYTGLQKTICSLLPGTETISAYSFRLDGMDFRKVHPKEVRVSFSDRSPSISSGNVFAKSGVVAFKEMDNEGSFGAEVSNRLFPLIGKPATEIKKELANIINEGGLMDVKDDDIEDCTIIAREDGRKKTIYLMNGGNFATRFPIDVPLNKDGHPQYEPTRDAILRILQHEIIARKEDV